MGSVARSDKKAYESSRADYSAEDSKTLVVDFSWKKCHAAITDQSNPSTPLYLVDFKAFKPHLVYKHAVDGSVFATGTLHPISIDAEVQIHGRPVTLVAQKRLWVEYSHLSTVFSEDGLKPATVTWSSTTGFKSWDFICKDESGAPMARFSARYWALKKIGNIEFLGEAAHNKEMQEEIVATGLTLFYCIALRSSNFFNLVGALFSRPGHKDKHAHHAYGEGFAAAGEFIGATSEGDAGHGDAGHADAGYSGDSGAVAGDGGGAAVAA